MILQDSLFYQWSVIWKVRGEKPLLYKLGILKEIFIKTMSDIFVWVISYWMDILISILGINFVFIVIESHLEWPTYIQPQRSGLSNTT